jgi:hypothetical protein
MSLDVTAPIIVSNFVLRALEDNLIAKKICNTKITEPVTSRGQSVTFPSISDPTISDYTGTTSWNDMAATDVKMLIDQAKYTQFKMDAVDAAHAEYKNFLADQAKRAGYLISVSMDTFVLGKYAEAGTTITRTAGGSNAVTTANVLSTMAAVSVALRQVNVMDGYVVIPPWFAAKLMLADVKFQVLEGPYKTGSIEKARINNLDVFVSNQLTNPLGGSGAGTEIIAGSYNSIGFAEQLNKVNYFDKLELSIGSGYQLLAIFGAKVLKPTELVRLTAENGAETTI